MSYVSKQFVEEKIIPAYVKKKIIKTISNIKKNKDRAELVKKRLDYSRLHSPKQIRPGIYSTT